METTHRQTGNRTTRLLLLHPVVGFDKLHHIRETLLHRALHRTRQLHAGTIQAQARFTRSGLLIHIAIGHDDNHRLRLALCNQVVQDLYGTA